jgi:GNAT superfamily N-acetyltransferase
VHTRIQQYLRAVAPLGRACEHIGPFLATFDLHDDNPYRNYALPEIGARPGDADVAALVAAYRAHGRRPRLEYLPTTAPGVEPVLLRAGFTPEGRLPLMVVPAARLRGAPPEVDGTTFAVPATDEDLLAMAMVQGAAYGDPVVPGPEVVARRRKALDGGALCLVARCDRDGEIVGAGSCSPVRDGLTEVASIAVAETHRRHGIGAALAARLAALALAHGADVPWLMAEGPPEERIYARMGFETIGEVLLISLPSGDDTPPPDA